jgi:hypothetical protein
MPEFINRAIKSIKKGWAKGTKFALRMFDKYPRRSMIVLWILWNLYSVLVYFVMIWLFDKILYPLLFKLVGW